VLLGYAILSLIVTYPLILHFGSATLGPQYADRMQNEWNLWWVQQALTQGRSPFHTDLLFYPQGVDLYFHTLNLPLALLALPFAALFGLTAGYNSSVILALTLAGYAGWRLAAYVTGQPAAAFFGGIIIGFNPLSLALVQGQVNALSLAPCVLCLEFYWRAWAAGRRRDAVWTGLFFALAVLTVGYYEGYLLLAFALHGLALLWGVVRGDDLSPNPSPTKGEAIAATDRASLTKGEVIAAADRPSPTKGEAIAAAALPSLRRGGVGGEVVALLRRTGWLLGWAGGTALLAAGPYAAAAWLSLGRGQIIPYSSADSGQTLANSADLLSFLLPSRLGWLWGSHAPWWQGVTRTIYDFTWLGPVTLGLAALGWWVGRRSPVVGGRWSVVGGRGSDVDKQSSGNGRPLTAIGARSAHRPPTTDHRPPTTPGFWIALAGLGAVLALGPVLQVGGQPVGDGAVALPFSLLRLLPPFNIMRVPFRFSTLTWIGLGVLAAGGVGLLLRPGGRGRRGAVGGVVAALLLLEMPLHVWPTRAATLPRSLAAVRDHAAPGALLELPFTQHGGLDAARMLYQTGHGRAISGGYLSRGIIAPDRQACSPFGVFSRYPDLPPHDIITPTATTQLPGVLAAAGVGFIAVYKWNTSDLNNGSRVAADDLAPLQALAAQLGPRLADDATATTYRVRPALPYSTRFLQLGPDWYQPETVAGQPFRWIDGAQADLCVFSPQPATGSLTVQATSFAVPRRLQVWIAGRPALDTTVPADGALHDLTVPPSRWPAGPQQVRLVAPGGSSTPAALGQGRDTRQLSIGFAAVRWQAAP